jgi:hypothetical protein
MRVHATALTATLLVLTGWPVSRAYAAGPSLWLAPATGSGSCTFTNTEIATADSFDESNSTSFVNLKEAGEIAFKQSKTGCVAGSFFANAGNESADDHVLLQVLLDGVACAPLTGGFVFANAGSDFTSHSVAFFCGAKIALGKHTIRVQYASGLGGKSAFFQHTLEVTHQ